MKSKEGEENLERPADSVTHVEPDTAPFLFEPGDIFMVSNRKELKVLHHIAQLGQRAAGNDNSDYHHAGIALSKKTLIEMGREEGMHLSDVSTLDGTTISIFRCKNKEVAKLAADLAANVESSLITEEYKDLKTDKANITYANWKAMLSTFSNTKEISQAGRDAIQKLAEDFKFPEELFCSEMVIIFYNLAAIILEQDLVFNVESQINPSVLYKYLTTKDKDNFEEIKLCFSAEAYSVDLKSTEKAAAEEVNTASSTQEFKETVNQIKNNNNNELEPEQVESISPK